MNAICPSCGRETGDKSYGFVKCEPADGQPGCVADSSPLIFHPNVHSNAWINNPAIQKLLKASRDISTAGLIMGNSKSTGEKLRNNLIEALKPFTGGSQ